MSPAFPPRSRAHSRLLAGLASLLLLAPSLFAAPPDVAPERFTFGDAGQVRTFAPVRDRVAVRDADGRVRFRALNLAADTADVSRQSRALPLAAGESVELLLAETTNGVTTSRIRHVRPEVVVLADSRAAAEAAALSAGLVYLRPAAGDRHILRAPSSAAALEAVATLLSAPGIREAVPSLARQQSKRLVPNDPLFPNQWHLRNTGQSGGTSGIDVNVVSVWDTRRGSGIRIGIIDDGLQTAHPDLLANVDTANDRDWNDSTPDDPNPVLSADFHGTACAGVAAAVGSNSLGVSGAAPAATLVGLRLIGDTTTDTQESEALAWKNDLIQIKSNSWGPNDDGLTLEGPGPLTAAALAAGTSTGRGGLGTIYLWAGGNGGDVGDDSNYDGYANSIHTIAVAALTQTGTRSYYSEPGANLVITAPSNGGTDPGITTVDLTGNDGYNYAGLSGNLSDRNYTNDFGGTSSATPLAAGVVALLLESRPTLGWRDVQEILMASATQVSPSDADWVVNAGGFHFNHKFGAGLVNASAAINLAATWTNLPAATSQTVPRTALGQTIPDNTPAGTSVTFDFSANPNLRVEHVTVAVNITHASRGQLAITLVSPQGTASRLAEKHADTGDNYAGWTFMTVRNWGESSQGVWTLQVSDLASGTTGTLASATLVVRGTAAADVNLRPTVASATLGSAAELFAENALPLVGLSVSDPEGDPVSLAYQWQQSPDGVAFTAGATAPALPGDGSRAGLIVRCRITPSDTEGSGAAFLTEARPLNRRPVVVAATGSAYAYDSELYVASRSGEFARPALINEFSQGTTGSKEWVEILFLNDADARGWTFADRNSGTVTFSQNALWSSVPAGTLLVLYNGADRDTTLSADIVAHAPSRALIIAHNNTTFFSGSWPALGNSAAEILVLRTAAGALVDGVSYGAETTHAPQLATVGSQKSAAYQSDTEAGAEIAANWLVQSAAGGVVSPAFGNGGVNTTFVAGLRAGTFDQPATFLLGSSSQTPAGLTLAADTGLLSGVITAAPGVYAIVIERTNGTETVSQTVRLLVTAADGSATIQAGATWSPLTDTTLPGSLTIAGSLHTAGHALTVQGTITLAGGSVTNPAPGSITYGGLVGGTLPGTTTLVAGGYAAWIATYPALTGADALRTADPDGDGQPNLLEHAFDTNPASAASRGVVGTSVVDGRLRLSFARPALPHLRYAVESCDDLATWTEIWSSAGANSTAATVTVEDTAALGAPPARRFLRLVVTEL